MGNTSDPFPVEAIMKAASARLLLGLALMAVSACSRTDQGGAQTRSARAREPLVIRWFGTRMFPGPNAVIPSMLAELVSTRVGYPVRFELLGGVNDTEHHATLQKMLEAGDLPDVFLYMGLDREFLSQAAATFQPPELFTNMPGMTRYLRGLMGDLGLNEQATWGMYRDGASGPMWGVPRTWDQGWIPSGQMWRKDILDRLGYAIPTTIAEAEKAFGAYKAVYPSKYAMGGSGKTDWQCFDIVWNAFGLVGGGQHVRERQIVQFFATPEFREALGTLRRWYERGFVDPSFVDHQNTDKFARFAAGDYLVTEWIGMANWDFLSGESTPYLDRLRDTVPGAVAVAATHLSAEPFARPIQRVWNPFLTQVTVFGKHLERDRDTLRRIMSVGDLIATDHEAKYLASYGIEGETYEIPKGETAPRGLPLPGGVSAAEKYGYGYFWAGTFATKSEPSSRQKRVLDEYVLRPEGIYGSSRLDRWFPLVNGPVTDLQGEPVRVSTPTSWFQMVVDIVTGRRQMEYYDEWLRQYEASGGRAWEEQATRLWLR